MPRMLRRGATDSRARPPAAAAHSPDVGWFDLLALCCFRCCVLGHLRGIGSRLVIHGNTWDSYAASVQMSLEVRDGVLSDLRCEYTSHACEWNVSRTLTVF